MDIEEGPFAEGPGSPDPGASPAAPAASSAAPEPTPSAAEIELAAERRVRREMLESMARVAPRAPEPARPTAAPEAPGPMPDPATDPDGFRRWHAQDREFRDYQYQRGIDLLREETVQQTNAAALWGEILVDPRTSDIARSHQWLFRSIWQERGARIEGDPVAFKESIIRDALDRVEALRGGAAARPASSSPATPPRTEGLSGGSEPGGAPRPRARGAADGKVLDLVDMIHDLRSKDPMGYYATNG